MTEEIKSAETTETAQEGAVEEVKEDADLDENSDGAEFSDGADTDGGRPEGEREKEKSNINTENAHRRRAQERARELEAARVNAIIEAVGENPFTGEELKDADDVAEYLQMRAIQKQGGDPIGDFAKFQKKKVREERAAEEEAAKKAAWYDSDRADFIKRHPEVDINKLINDSRFAEYADGKVGARPLAEIYESYERHVKQLEKSAEARAAQALANSKASPGALAGGKTPDNDHFTYEQVKAMSDAEVRKNYDKIRESMKTWKK